MTEGNRGSLEVQSLRKYNLEHPAPESHDSTGPDGEVIACQCLECDDSVLTEEDARAAGAHVTVDGPVQPPAEPLSPAQRESMRAAPPGQVPQQW